MTKSSNSHMETQAGSLYNEVSYSIREESDMIQAVFFDIDGTLVSFQTHRVSPTVLDGLRQLQEKGIKLFIATGRQWEAAAAAAKFKLDNLVAFLDNNGLQISGKVTEIMSMVPIDKKFEAFGWAVKRIDGNDMGEILDALDSIPVEPGKPTLILCSTVKAKGLSFGEDKVEFHFWNATPELLEQAEREMDGQISTLKSELEALEK